MLCSRARNIMEQKELQGVDPRDEQLLAEHRSVCRACAEFEDQLARTWNALEYYPALEPSRDFIPNLRARLRAEQVPPGARPGWRLFNMRWQWAVAAACVLLAVAVISRSTYDRHVSLQLDKGAASVSERDRLDDQFLEDLERTLRHSDADYLSTYDSWPDVLKEATNAGSVKTKTSGVLKRRETS